MQTNPWVDDEKESLTKRELGIERDIAHVIALASLQRLLKINVKVNHSHSVLPVTFSKRFFQSF